MTYELPKPTIWVKITPPMWATLFIGLAWLVSRAVSLPIVFKSTLVGLSVFAAGAAISASGVIRFARSKTEIMPASNKNTHLVVTGPYKFTRNPMYLGILVALMGLAITLGTIAGWIAALIFFVFVNAVSVPYEETKMDAQFSEDYRAYKSRVRRWI